MENRYKSLETCVILSLAVLVIFGFIKKDYRTSIYISTAILATAVIIKPVAYLIHRIWMFIADKVSYINTRILLTLIFVFALTPLAILRRTFTRSDPLRLKAPDSSNLITREHKYDKNDLIKPY